MLSKKYAIKKLFSKNPQSLYHIAMVKVIGLIREAYHFFENDYPVLDQIENMRSTFYCLKLPHTIYVDMFFKGLPREAISVKDEGMKSTGYCEDCCRHYWCLENDAHECANGMRTVGCCSHIAAIVYYLSYARYLSNIIRPAEMLSRLFLTHGVSVTVNEDSDSD